MLPDLPAITRCKGCGAFYWLDDAKEARRWPGGLRTADRSPASRGFPCPISPRPWPQGSATTRPRELYLRVRLWWAGNGRSRSTGRRSAGGGAARKAQGLASLLDYVLATNGRFSGAGMSEEEEAEWRRNAEALASLLDESAGKND